jgi:hypothetical protein
VKAVCVRRSSIRHNNNNNNNNNDNNNPIDNNNSDAKQMPSNSLSLFLTDTTQEASSTRDTQHKRKTTQETHNTRDFFFNQLYKTA